MSGQHVSIGLLLAVLLLAPGCSGTPDQRALSDAFAKLTIERYWQKIAIRQVIVGDFAVMGPNPIEQPKADYSRGVVTGQELDAYRLLQNFGVVRLQIADLSRQSFNWLNYSQMSQGVQYRIKVVPGEKAQQFACDEATKTLAKQFADRVLCISQGKGRVESIVRNELRTIGADEYRLVTGTHVWDWTPVGSELASRAEGRPVSKERKFSMLLKYDAFKSDWQPELADFANRDEEFRTRATFAFLEAHPVTK
jgi:hypothetical protein